MEAISRVDLTELEEGTVLLIDTVDHRTYKLVLDKGNDDFDIANVLLSVDDGIEETDSVYAVVSQVQVGKPMSVVDAPERKTIRGAFDMKSYETKEVVSIEVYS